MLDFETMLSEGKYTYIDDNKYEYSCLPNFKVEIKFNRTGIEFFFEYGCLYSYSLNERSKYAMMYDSIYKDVNKSLLCMYKIAYFLEGI